MANISTANLFNSPGVAVPVNKWKHISEIRDEGIEYMENRMKGLITSFRTPWQTFNDFGIDGFEWGTVNVIGGRPASGKTTIVNTITRNGFQHNKADYAVLDFQFEMTAKTTAVREFTGVLKQDYATLLSANRYRPITPNDIQMARNYAAQHKNERIYQIEEAQTVKGIEEQVDRFWKFIQMPFVVSIDHSILVKKGTSEKDKFETLYELGEALTRMKKSYPVIFLILTQMNRSIEAMERKFPGTVGNFPNTADVWGADALLQHCDMMMAINRPALYNLPTYGPEQVVVYPDLLAVHFLKVRNGTPGVAYYKADFGKSGMIEDPSPNKSGQAPQGGTISTANLGTKYGRKGQQQYP